MTAKKYDQGKPQLTLVMRGLVDGVARVGAFGVEKYGRDNYRSPPGLKVSRLLDAALRHLVAAVNGEIIDPESGLDHLDHAAWEIGAAMEMLRLYPDNDDRFQADAPTKPAGGLADSTGPGAKPPGYDHLTDEEYALMIDHGVEPLPKGARAADGDCGWWVGGESGDDLREGLKCSGWQADGEHAGETIDGSRLVLWRVRQ